MKKFSGWEGRRSSRIYTNLLKWHAACTSSLSRRFPVPFYPWPPVWNTVCPSCRHPLSSCFLLIANKDDGEMFEWIYTRGQHPLSTTPSLLGLFFAVNYFSELITFFFFFFFVVVLIFVVSFNSCLSYSCHFRDCLFPLLTFFPPFLTSLLHFYAMSEKGPFHSPFIC